MVADSSSPSTADMAAISLITNRPPVHTFINIILHGITAGDDLIGQRFVIGGWVKTDQEQGKGTFAFLELNGGSCLSNLQVIVDTEVHPLSQLVPTGTSMLVEGDLKKPPEGTKQSVELWVERMIKIRTVDPAKYLLPNTRLTLERLREIVHFRAHTNMVIVNAKVHPMSQIVPTRPP